jgi:hypothetical protein
MTSPAPQPRAKSGPPKDLGILGIDFGVLSTRSSTLFRASTVVIAILSAVATSRLLLTHPDFVLPFLLIAVPLIAGLYLWSTGGNHGLPLLPIFLLQQGLVYALPLLTNHPGLKFVNHEVILSSCLDVGLFLLLCLAGWFLGKSATVSRPSRANLNMSGTGSDFDRCLNVSFVLLAVCLGFHLLSRSGLLFQILPGAARLFPVIRTSATAAGTLGALFGALAIGSKPGLPRAWIYWALLAGIFCLSVADVLLSGASGIVLSAAVGLALGKRKVPVKFLICTFSIVAFLNQGKFVMRDRYWGADSNTSGTSLVGLPGFYAEWAAESAACLAGTSSSGILRKNNDDEGQGQSFLERINNLQNMTYVIECFSQRRTAPMMGETYALIPPLFVPRFMWSEKPRTHEGQIRLNLHFGRQSSVEQTEKTYIAWGLLPEAVGNFGPRLGAIVLGLVLGFTMGWVETVSRRKRIFSVEGMVLSGVLLITATSYEQVASVFLTAMFQFLVAITIGGFLLRSWFGHGESEATSPRKSRAKAMM